MLDTLERFLLNFFDSLGEVSIDNPRWYFFCGSIVGLFNGVLGSWAMIQFGGRLLFFMEACLWISLGSFVIGFTILSSQTRWQTALSVTSAGAFGLFIYLCVPILLGWAYTSLDFNDKIGVTFLVVALILACVRYENPRLDKMHPMDLADPGPGP